MKRNHLITLAGGMVALAMTFAACSQDETTTIEKPTAAAEETVEEGPVVYTMHLNCEAPGYEENGTRATTTWANGSTIYLRFGSVAGTATYSSSSGAWTVATSGTLATTTSETTCYAYYFENPGTVTSTTVSLTEKSAIYQGTGKYTHPSSSDIYVTATLDPLTWRLRFNGGSVALMGSESDLNYNSAFNRSTGSFTTSKMGDVDLTSSDYVYGMFANTGDNRIQVQTDNVYYTTVSASKLQAKESAYLTAPNSSNYQAKNWIPIPPNPDNCTVEPQYLAVLSASFVTDFSVGGNVASCYFENYSESQISGLTDDQIITKLKNGTSYTAERMSDLLTRRRNLTSSSTYYLCSVAFDADGNQGPLVKTKIVTKSSTNQPLAEISDFMSATNEGSDYWVWTVNASSNAAQYYMFCTESSLWYDDDDDWNAWAIYKAAKSGDLTRTYTESTTWQMSRSGSSAFVMTWALDSTGEWSGYYSTARATAAASSPMVRRPSQQHGQDFADKNLLKETINVTGPYSIW